MITPIFVVGAPRSGTTLISSWIAGSPLVCNLGEYGGFYLGGYFLPNHFFQKMPSIFKEELISRINSTIHDFAINKTLEGKRSYFLDSTPSNLLLISHIESYFPNAVYVLVLRHYSGVIQSLSRSAKSGYAWAGTTSKHRAEIWVAHYANVALLPTPRTIAISYDALCENPINTLAKIHDELSKFGLDANLFDLHQFCISHANDASCHRKTIGKMGHDGQTNLEPISSYDKKQWTQRLHEQIEPLVSCVDLFLKQKYESIYLPPADFLY